MGPLRWFENLFVNTSESMKRWSGFRRGWVGVGLGSTAYAMDAFGSVGLCEGAFRMFFGSIESGGELSTSVYSMVKDCIARNDH